MRIRVSVLPSGASMMENKSASCIDIGDRRVRGRGDRSLLPLSVRGRVREIRSIVCRCKRMRSAGLRTFLTDVTMKIVHFLVYIRVMAHTSLT